MHTRLSRQGGAGRAVAVSPAVLTDPNCRSLCGATHVCCQASACNVRGRCTDVRLRHALQRVSMPLGVFPWVLC